LRYVLRIRKKDILILSKKLREEAGLREGDEVIVEVEESKLVMKVLKPKVVDVDPSVVGELLREEYEIEKSRYGRHSVIKRFTGVLAEYVVLRSGRSGVVNLLGACVTAGLAGEHL